MFSFGFPPFQQLSELPDIDIVKCVQQTYYILFLVIRQKKQICIVDYEEDIRDNSY